jgi:septal ring factor EnvC (AmiA/AmiB activator)
VSEHTTGELPKVDPVLEILKEVRSDVHALRADVALVSNDLGVVKDRVALVETRVVDLEAARSRTSNRVREVSQSDLNQEAQLAQERSAREELAKQVASLAESNQVQLAILTRLDRLAANPHVKIILAVLATAATTWLASKGLK